MNEMARCCLSLGLGGLHGAGAGVVPPAARQHACTAHGRGLPFLAFADAPARRTLAHVCAGGKLAAATPAPQHCRLPRGGNHGRQGHVAHGESCSPNHTTQCTATATTHPHPTPHTATHPPMHTITHCHHPGSVHSAAILPLSRAARSSPYLSNLALPCFWPKIPTGDDGGWRRIPPAADRQQKHAAPPVWVVRPWEARGPGCGERHPLPTLAPPHPL